MRLRKLLLILLPLLIGVGIYLLYRSRNLFYYQFIEETHFHPYITSLRENAKIYRSIFSTWIVYSLPDGLWLFSFGAALLVDRVYYYLHFILFTCIFGTMIGIEYLQKYLGGHGHWLGTYDFQDIEAYSIAYVSIVCISFILHLFAKKRFQNKKAECITDFYYIILFSILGTLPSLFITMR